MKRGQEEPLVSVLMTAYNRQAFIAEAIESVLSSDYKNFELIIVDDYSTDDTVSIIKNYSIQDKRIKFYVNDNNLGDYPNRNKAASLAKGKYIMYCDSDDCFFKDTLSYCLNEMEVNPNADLGMYYKSESLKSFTLNPKESIRKHFFQNPFLFIGPGGTIINRAYFNKIGGYPEKYGPANDMYFNLKAGSNTDILLLPKLFLHYRRHEGQQQNNLYNYIHFNYRYLDDALNNLDLELTAKEIKYLKNKNKRRFVVNLFNQFIKTKNLKSVHNLWVKADFNLINFIQGIIH